MISPRLPFIKAMRLTSAREAPASGAWRRPPGARSRAGRRAPLMSNSCIEPREYDRRIGAAEAERVRQHATERDVVAALAHDRHVRERRIEIFDIGALADEAVVHHQQRI